MSSGNMPVMSVSDSSHHITNTNTHSVGGNKLKGRQTINHLTNTNNNSGISDSNIHSNKGNTYGGSVYSTNTHRNTINSGTNTFSNPASIHNSPRIYTPGMKHANVITDNDALELQHEVENMVPKLKGVKMLY